MPTPARDFTLPFLRKEQFTSDTYAFYFDRSQVDFDFLPGQYIRMFLNIPEPDERGSARYFTIASSPLQTNILMITTRIIQSSFKKSLLALTPGEQIRFFGPAGRFILDETDTRPRVFLAGGIGITPFHSMITYASAKQLSLPITLLVSFPTSEQMVFYQELRQLQADHANTTVVYTSTHQEASKESWEGEKGRISAELIQKYVPDIHAPIYMIVGPPAMVDAMEIIVTAMGIPKEQIKTEKFPGY